MEERRVRALKKYFTHKIKKAVDVKNLITIENLALSEGFFFPEETHEFFEFSYVDSGSLVCYLDGERVEMSEGDFLSISPGKSHRYEAAGGDTSVFIVCFRCTAEILTVFDRKITLDKQMKLLLSDIINESKQAFAFPFDNKLKPLPSPIFGAQQLVENNIEKLFIYLIRKEVAERESIVLVTDSLELESSLVNDVVGFMKARLYERITLDDICKQTFYSKTFLNEIFKRNMGASIMKYYNRLKISEAKRLLRGGSTPAEVASRLRFESASYFTKVFKRHTGVTPMEYRKKLL